MKHPGRTRLVLAAPHPIVLDALERLFGAERDLQVLARCGDSDETLAAIPRHRPHVLVLDPRLPGVAGLAILQQLQRDHSRTRVVLFVNTLSDDEAIEAMRLSVRGVVLKEQPPHQLVQCVRKVRAGGFWFERTAVGQALDTLLRRENGARDVAGVLTPREVELVRMVGLGVGSELIAERLAISHGTVKVHLHNIYRKLNLAGRVELMLFAREKQLI